MACQKSDCFIVVMQTRESGWSEGGSKQAIPEWKQTWHRRPERMEPKTKGIGHQSASYPVVQNLMHNVNEQTLMVEHRKQVRKKATGISEVSAYLGFLRSGAALDDGHLELAAEGCLKSRMRENRTYGSVRGSRHAFHVKKYSGRSVETVYSTEKLCRSFNLS